MKFFLPAATSDEQAEEVYDAIRKHLAQGLGAECTEDRYYTIRYRHEGMSYLAEVGKPHAYGETVIAILYEPLRRLYHVCTPNRGVIRGVSILVGEHEVEAATRFEIVPK